MHAGADRVRTICCNKYFDNTSPLLVAGVPAVSVYIVIAQPAGWTVDTAGIIAGLMHAHNTTTISSM